MADNKPDPKTDPQPGTAGTEVSTREQQYETGPAKSQAAAAGKKAKYYLREGKEHYGVVDGERKHLSEEGDAIELTAAQAEAFSDKFMSASEFKGLKAEREARAEGARAAEAEVAAATKGSEQPTPEERNAENNEEKGKGTASGQTSAPPKK